MVPPLVVEQDRAFGKRAKGKPTIVVVAEPDPDLAEADQAESSPSEWGSLLGDLAPRPLRSTDDPVEWRVHDRTHLEFAIDYAFDEKAAQSYRWEAYFFVPDSFRLQQTTYDKKRRSTTISSATCASPSRRSPRRRSPRPVAPARATWTPWVTSEPT
jgi:hypothetical protein